jgi:phage baseplate assembly protein W
MSFNLGVLKLVHVPSGLAHSNLDKFNFGARGIEEILQNARNILTTPKGTQVLHRDFGVEMGFQEAPSLNEAQQLFGNELEKLWEFEPRVRRWNLNFNSTGSELNPIVTIFTD